MIPMCSVDGCERPVDSRGWCRAHYERWRVGGDVRADDPIQAKGKPEEFYRTVVMSHREDECLFWPFARNDQGYAHGWIDGALQYIHRLACEQENGSPPTAEHEAAHSCGRGHLGCVARRHLRWKTHAENIAEAVEHGSLQRGEDRWNAKLTEADVRAIRSMLGTNTQQRIADQFGISREMVSRIKRGLAWSWLA